MTVLAELLMQLRRDLVEEASALPGQQLSYGRPHAHPRARYFPRYSPTGERIPGVNLVRPDCPRPVKGRCECPPDGTWRPVVGVLRADTTAQHATVARPEQLPPGLADDAKVWVDEVYVQGPDGLWRCRWPVRRALERLRGSSIRRWSIVVRLLQGESLMHVWGSHGPPPEPMGEAIRLVNQLDRWAIEEREIEWERRPRQWWDPPKKPNGRSIARSEAQNIAEHGSNVAGGLHPHISAAILPAIGRAEPSSPIRRLRRGRQVEQSSGPSDARSPSGIPTPITG